MKAAVCRLAMMAVTLALTAGAHAASPYLVKDVNPSVNLAGSSAPGSFFTLGGTTYFYANDGLHGSEMFKSDGTEAGTGLVKDLVPGVNSSYPESWVDLGGQLYFFCQGGLWKSDGTAAGTTLVKQAGAYPEYYEVAEIDGKIFFPGEDTTNGLELWVSDGTEAGTAMVKNIHAGSTDSYPSEFCNMNGKLIFSAYDATGCNPWVSDGTEAGTTRLKDIDAGSISYPDRFVNVGALTFFVQHHDDGTETLYKTTGTEASTAAVKTFTWIGFRAPVAFAGKLFFTAYDAGESDVWVSDGTAAGTVMFKDVEAGSEVPCSIVVGSYYYFVTTHETNGIKLWRTDGTAGGTIMLAQLAPTWSSSDHLQYYPRELNGKMVLIYQAPYVTNGSHMWVSDGTPAGTADVMDLTIGTPSIMSPPVALQAGNGLLYFENSVDGHGCEPWVTDGTLAGTRMLKEINQVGVGIDTTLAAGCGRAFFAYNDSVHGSELWSSDGTEAGTFMVKDINAGTTGSTPVSIVSFMNKVFFVAADGVHGKELWSSDGTAAGTAMVSDLEPGAAGAFKTNPFDWCFAAGNRLYFKATTTAQGTGLWCTDGSAVTFLSPVIPYVNISYPSGWFMCDWNGRFIFTGIDATYGAELWISDGTPSGTHIVKDVTPGPGGGFAFYYPTPVGDRFYFMYPTEACWLYVSDGTADGTMGIHQFPLDPMRRTLYQITAIAALGNKAVLRFRGPTTQLWASDGTSETTLLINDTATASMLAPIYGQMYLSGTDGTYGTELWRTDGTAGGTQLFADLNPGTNYSNPANPLVLDGRLYFTAYDATHGSELWATDGTLGGTGLVGDINTDSFSSSPAQLTGAGRNLFFLADDGVHGRELWALPLDGRAAETIDVAAGDTAPVASATAAMAVDFSGNSAPGRLSMARYDAMAPGRSSDVPGYWIVSGLNESTFSVVLTFSYDPATVAAAGLSDANLRLIRSTDGGRTWAEVASVVDAEANTIRTASAQTALGMYAISAADRVPGMEIWVNFYWNNFEAGTAADPFNTLIEGVTAVSSGGTIKVNSGVSSETTRITKPMRIESVGGTARIGAH